MTYTATKEKALKKIVIDESLSTEKLKRFEAYARKKGFWTPGCVLIAKQHPGMPDVQIIHHLLDHNTILVTSDRPFHNRILAKGLKSYYVSEEIITDKPLKGIDAKPVIRLNKNDLVLKDSYHQPKTEIRSLLLPSSSKHLKKLYTRRRRIRSYFDGLDHLERISAAVSWKSMGTEILVGLQVRVSSNVGIKALDASENYITEPVKPEYRNIVALCHALVLVIGLMLHSLGTVVYYDAAVIDDPIKQPSKDFDETFQLFFNELAGSFKHLEFVPVSKGKHIEKLRAKLDQLIREKKKTNEIVPGNIWEILDKFKRME
jgi:hypothetical protein